MAHHKSTIKRIRQTKVRTERNRFYRTRITNITRAVKEAVESGDKEQANIALQKADKEFQKFVSKKIIKKNTASRKVSRLAKMVNALQA
ncbi:MAG: 30S ribosomal protein S20 [Campylobacterota bacterium]